MVDNNTQITSEILLNNTLIFQPKTTDEAAFIQKKIFMLGGRWGAGATPRKIQELGGCVDKGMMVVKGWLYYNPNSESRNKGILCTSGQFDKAYAPPLSAKQQSAFAAAFSKVSELTDRLAEVEQILADAGLSSRTSGAGAPKSP